MSAPSSPPSNGTAPAASPPTAPAPTPPPVVPAPPPKAPPPASPPPVVPAPPPKAPPPASPPPTTPPTATPPPVTPASPPSTPDTPVAPPPPVMPDTPPSAPSPPSPSNPTPSNPTPSNPSPSKPNSPPSTPPSSSSSNSLSVPVVVGVAAGGIVVLLIASLICVLCLKKKKRRREDNIPMHYSGAPPPPGMYKEDPYVRPYQQWQQPPDHVVKPSSDPGPPPPYGSRPPQGPPTPPPPPPGQVNSGGSGSNYSGGDLLPPPSPGMAFGMSKSTFTYEELVLATDGFSDANLLGQGGFGYVHKGVLPNGKEVAVKQLKIGSGQGEREFQAEVEIISRVHHKHLVSLVGYCMSGGHQRLLVYEFVPNNTLEFHLHGKGRPTMEWPARLRIALGSAKGLAYLHEDCHPKIIHRDIKASNILLDDKFEAKVADFGLAKFTEENNTHVSTRVMGTFGYLAPEYASSGKLTEKSDVFSFGVMVLELITGRRPVDTTQTYMDDSLVDWARPLMQRALEDGNSEQLVDPKLQKNYKENEMARMIAVAAACVRHSAKRRPRMSKVVRALEGDTSLEDLQDGMTPGHSRNVGGSYTSSEYDSSTYNEDMKKFRKMAMQSGDYQSSQYSAPTSEYGLNPSGSSSEGQNTREMEMGKMKNKDSY